MDCYRQSKHGLSTMNLQANIKAWSGNTLLRTKKFKSVPSAGKFMLILFRDFSGPFLKHYQNHGQMASSEHYCVLCHA